MTALPSFSRESAALEAAFGTEEGFRSTVARRIRRRRRLLGLTQQNLAHSVGIRFQQIQKYECGHNRVGLYRMLQLCQAMGIDLGYLMPDHSVQPQKTVSGLMDGEEFYRHLGRQMRFLRQNLKMTQAQAGKRAGLSFQQIQKYESAANRVSAYRYFQLMVDAYGFTPDQAIGALTEIARGLNGAREYTPVITPVSSPVAAFAGPLQPRI